MHHRKILRQFYLRISREWLFVLILGHMRTYPSALPDCPAETVLLSMHVTLLACYLVFQRPVECFGGVPKMARVDMEPGRRRETALCPINSYRCKTNACFIS